MAHTEARARVVATLAFRPKQASGYRNSDINIPSPYLWSFSQHYKRGKFDTDRHFNPTLVSQQCGAAVLIRVMVNDGHITPPATTDEF